MRKDGEIGTWTLREQQQTSKKGRETILKWFCAERILFIWEESYLSCFCHYEVSLSFELNSSSEEVVPCLNYLASYQYHHMTHNCIEKSRQKKERRVIANGIISCWQLVPYRCCRVGTKVDERIKITQQTKVQHKGKRSIIGKHVCNLVC